MPAPRFPPSPKPGATAKFSRCHARSRLRAAEEDGWCHATRSRTWSKEGPSLGPGCGSAGHGRPSAVLVTAIWTATESVPHQRFDHRGRAESPEAHPVTDEALRPCTPPAADLAAEHEQLLRPASRELGVCHALAAFRVLESGLNPAQRTART